MKLIIIFFIASLTFNYSYSQIQFGIKSGLNVATVRDINSDNSKARFGWHAGFLALIPIEQNIFIRPELLYSSKGFGYSATQNNNSGSLKLNYIDAPVLFGYHFSKQASIMAGPEFGFLQKSVSKSQGISSDMTGFYRHFDLGVDLGLAFNINRNLGIEARYNYGFKDLVNVVIIDNNGNFIGQGKTGANSVIQLGFYYFFTP